MNETNKKLKKLANFLQRDSKSILFTEENIKSTYINDNEFVNLFNDFY